ncbi:hypothetical protein AAVH_37758 [Aphelenchoides avenae]|nr:hypothetical protein AAVH_37758 [Aphelenchus avenae]
MSVLGNLSSKPDIYKPCAAGFLSWTSEVDTIATKAVVNATSSINPSSWEARQSVHELAAKDIVAKLSGSTYNEGYYFKALASLAFTDEGHQGYLGLSVGAEDVVRNDSKLVKYVVSRYRKRADKLQNLLREKWDAIEEKGDRILDATFSTTAFNVSKRVEEVERRFEKEIGGAFLSADGFRALVALRCGYEFVWYELGYRCFPAGFATGGYTLATKQDNKYKYNCGQIVFFP